MLELLKLIYGMTDVDNYWGVTVYCHAKVDLGLVTSRGDPSLYMKSNEEDLDGQFGMYVDDVFLAGNDKLQRTTERTIRKFDSKLRKWDIFTFFRTYIVTKQDGSFDITQNTYIKRRNPVPLNASFELF